MNLIERLRKEHTELKGMLDELSHLTDGERKSHDYIASFQRIIAHESSEGAVLYRPLKGEPRLDMVVEQVCDEHEAIKHVIDEMKEISPDNMIWGDRMVTLIAMMEGHIRNEEAIVFPMAIDVLGEERLKSMDEDYRSMEEELRRPPVRALHRF